MSSTTRNLLRRQYNCYGDYFDILDFNKSPNHLSSSSPHSLITSSMSNQQQHQNEEAKEAQGQDMGTPQLVTRDCTEVGTSRSAAVRDPDDSWLQLSIGPSTSSPASLRAPAMVPLSNYYSRQQPPPPPWAARQHQYFVSPTLTNVGYNVPRMMPREQTRMRVVRAPASRQHVGIWFHLKAAENQVRMLSLPQIPKSYIRIKDGGMTVRLLMKYLVNKLGLNDDFEVQISCRGQLLLPFLSIQHVRDQIWRSSESVAFLPDSPSIDHVMTLHYSRRP